MPRPFLSFLALGFLLGGKAAAQSRTVDCAPVLERLNKDFAAQPGRLVLAVEDALTVSEACACPVIQQAAELAGRDPVLTGELVAAALRVAPSAAAAIVECALERVPEASTHIREAIDRVLGERASGLLSPESEKLASETVTESKSGDSEKIHDPEVVTGKGSVGKAPVGKEPAVSVNTEDFDTVAPVGMTGIYLFSPARASFVVEKETKETIVKIVKRERKVVKPSRPSTPSSPEGPPN